MKKVLESKKGGSLQKLKALTVLHHCLVDGRNPELVMYAEKKILNKLQTLSRFKKVSILDMIHLDLFRNQPTRNVVHFYLARTVIRTNLLSFSSTS